MQTSRMKLKLANNIKIKENEYLWRYMDLYKLISLIHEKELFFSRADFFEDKLECLNNNILNLLISYSTHRVNHPIIADLKNKFLQESSKIKKSLFINCWHLNQRESYAMWNIYSDQSIAIKFNAHDLIEAVKDQSKSYSDSKFNDTMLYGLVEYVDIYPKPNIEKLNDGSIIYVPFKKDSTYYYEKEFRFVTEAPSNESGNIKNFKFPFPKINSLNFEIYLHPKMNDLKKEGIKTILKKFNLIDKISESKLLLNI